MPSETSAPVIVWFRQDLRLADHPALAEAAARGAPVLPVYIWGPEEETPWAPGGAARWWIHHALASLDAELQAIGSRLILRRGAALPALQELARATGANTVLWNRRYEPAVIARDTRVKEGLRAAGLEARSFNGSTLFEPGGVLTQQQRPFQVFTPYYRACLAAAEPGDPLPAPACLRAPESWPESIPLAGLELLPRIPWDTGMRAAWQPGRTGALRALATFTRRTLLDYKTGRDRPSESGTSRLSPYLHHGELSPREVWQAVRARTETEHGTGWIAAGECYLREVVWREFAIQLLFHFPHTTTQPLRPAFAAFPWRDDPGHLRAWQRGRTGYPLIDAGMRELWQTGWMHNRVRMITASFLVKHLLIPWQRGAEWFWDTLVDADLANNSLGWQWTAGCGADAAPYFRIFNPISQGEKFEAHAYVRRFVPELARVPDKFLFSPWDAPFGQRGDDYPPPLVQHSEARDRALEAFHTIRGGD